MIKIRQGTFETNSSSVHSFSIANSEKKYTISDLVNKLKTCDILKEYNEKYTLYIDLSKEFEWGYAEYGDIETKLSYIALHYIKSNEFMHFSNISVAEILLSNTNSFGYLIECIEVNIRNRLSIVDTKSKKNAKDIYYMDLKGYIDHQSLYKPLSHFLRSESKNENDINDDLVNFLMNDDSYIIIDNDNH